MTALTDRLTAWSIRHPTLAIVSSAVVCLLLALPALDLHLDGDARRLLPADEPAVRDFRTLIDRFGASEQTVVVAELPADADATDAAKPVTAEQRARLWAAIDDIGARLQAATWNPPDAPEPAALVSGITGLPDPARLQAVEDLVLVHTWLFLPAETRALVLRALEPRRVARRLELGGRPDTPPQWRQRDPLGVWTEYFLPFWRTLTPSDTPIRRVEGHLASQDGRTAVLIVRPARPAQDGAFTSVFAAELEKMLATVRTDPRHAGIAVDAVGGHLIAAADYATARSSALSTLIQGSLGILLLFALVFRSVRLVAYLGVTLLPASLAALGLARLLLGPELSLLVVAFAVILIGLGVDFTIHLDSACARLLAAGRSRVEAAREAMRELAGPIITGGATSIAAFAVLGLAAFPGLRELGLVAAGGLAIMLIQVLVTAPGFLARHARSGRIGVRVGTGIGAICGARRWPSLLFLCALTALVVWDQLETPAAARFDGRARNLRPAHDPLFDRQAAIAKRLGLGVDQIHLLIHGQDPEAVLAAGVACARRLATLSTPVDMSVQVPLAHNLPSEIPVHSDGVLRAGAVVCDTPRGRLAASAISAGKLIDPHWLDPDRAAEPLPAGTIIQVRPLVRAGEWQILPLADPQRQRVAMAEFAAQVDWDALSTLQAADTNGKWAPFWADLATWRDHSRAAVPLTPNHFLDTPLEPLVRNAWAKNADGIWFALRFPVADFGRAGIHHRDVVDALQLNELPAGITATITGVPVIAEALATGLAADFIRLGGWSLLLIAVILSWQLRGIRSALCALLVLVIGGLGTQALLSLFGIPWNLINVAALPLLFGLGIDAAIYTVMALRRSPGDARGRATAIAAVAPPLLMTTATTVVGFASLLLNPYRGLQSLGAVAIIGMTVFLLVALTLPSLFRQKSSSTL